jgi:vacuolar iron transporter family protein
MSQTPHIEKHFTSSRVVRDIIIGMSDGFTVPFAMVAGLSGADQSTTVVIAAGLAEISAGSISMGLGGYQAARNDAEHYYNERAREQQEVKEMTEEERRETYDIFRAYGLPHEAITPIVQSFEKKPEAWVDFMMRYELGLEEPDPKQAQKTTITIMIAYIIAGFVPLTPYFLVHDPKKGLMISAIATITALFTFGYIKSKIIGTEPLMGALRVTLIGTLAAMAAFLLAKYFA